MFFGSIFFPIFDYFFDRFTLRNISFDTSEKRGENRENSGFSEGSKKALFWGFLGSFLPPKTELLIFENGTKSIVKSEKNTKKRVVLPYAT